MILGNSRYSSILLRSLDLLQYEEMLPIIGSSRKINRERSIWRARFFGSPCDHRRNCPAFSAGTVMVLSSCGSPAGTPYTNIRRTSMQQGSVIRNLPRDRAGDAGCTRTPPFVVANVVLSNPC